MTPHEIMICLSRIFNGYEATCWLSKERPSFGGYSAAELMKEGKSSDVESALMEETKYKKFEERRKAVQKKWDKTAKS